jgi:hypothetical protein
MNSYRCLIYSVNVVFQTLREHIADRNFRFVFPSQIASDLWARKTCTLGIARSVAKNRFLAWDDFKKEAIQEKETKRQPATAVMRDLFADALAKRNSERSFLKSLIPPEYSGNGKVFAPFIARLLPSLKYWETLMEKFPARQKDAEDEDYETLKKEYTAFLTCYDLFEPSWEELKTHEGQTRYVIFFPELIEDFAEYDALLLPPQFTCISVRELDREISGAQNLLFYKSAKAEIRDAVMELRRLHEEEGIPYEDMAVSVPELEEMEADLLKEFFLRQVPVTRRAGKKLGETGAGRLFALANECAASAFSFNSLKALILNDHIPWKEPEKNKALVRFGIKYNCVSAYLQDGKAVDIWEEAFREAHDSGSRELQKYYRDIKNNVKQIAGSKNFSEIQKYYFAFRGSLLNMERIAIEDNDILSRCIAELGSFIELEEKFIDPPLVPSSAFVFFLSYLNGKEYVRKEQKSGVNIFRWRVAAAAPFACHFVLNASQNAASVLYQPLKFLRQDKRKALGLEDADASGAFFLLCDTGRDTVDGAGFKTHARISASAQTFSGWAIPHSFFAQGKIVEPPESSFDPYAEERRFWKEGTALDKIFPLQKRSYECWKETFVQKENHFSFFTTPVSAEKGSAVRKLLESATQDDDGYLAVTPTRDLNVYYGCALSWLYARVFKAEEFSLEAALLDDTSLGILYHKILEELFTKIKSEDRVFDSSRLGAYKNWAFEITREAIKEHPAFKGPLAVPLVSPQAAGMAKKIERLLELEAANFSGYEVSELELHVDREVGDLLINGVIDRVSVSPDGEPVIIDYKTNYLPEQTAEEDLAEVPLSEFQMPLYIKLYEENASGKVQGAFFYSVNGRRIKAVVGETAGGRSKSPDREGYEPFLEAAEKQIEEFGRKVKALEFTPREIRIRDCLGCAYKTACRTVY